LAGLLIVLECDPKAVTDDEEITGATAYPYAHEILVEVTCRDADGDLVVYSYAFDPADDGTATPAEPVPDRHRDVVTEALAEKDIEPDGDLADVTG
jgi:hypothetical protein